MKTSTMLLLVGAGVGAYYLIKQGQSATAQTIASQWPAQAPTAAATVTAGVVAGPAQTSIVDRYDGQPIELAGSLGGSIF